MELRDYLRAVRAQWWLVLAMVTLAIGLAVVITKHTPAQYATTMTFFVTTPTQSVTVVDAYQGGLFSQQRVKSYARLLTSDRLADVIAAQPGIELSAAEVRKRISGKPVPETVMLQATVTDEDKERSKIIGEVLAVQFTRLVESLETPPGAQVSTVKVEVVAGPDLGQTPVAPRPARNLTLAGVIGLLLGVGGAVLREMLDSTVKNAESLQRIVNAPVLATVPFDPTAKKAPVMIGRSRRSHRAEALRKLRTNLHFVDVDEPVRTIVVTSAVSGEGKSSTAVNLAVVFAEASATVLLIDADLRRPRLAEYLGLEGSVGLTNVLAGQLSDTEAVQPWGGGLSVLPSGFIPPNPSELLGSRHMRDLLDRLRDQYDIIIIDSPPLLPVTDAAVVATRADGALLMTRSGKTSQAQARAAAAALSAVGARLLGGVINMEPRRGADRYQYYEYSGSLSPNQTQPVPGDDASTEIAGSASIAQLPGVRTTSPR